MLLHLSGVGNTEKTLFTRSARSLLWHGIEPIAIYSNLCFVNIYLPIVLYLRENDLVQGAGVEPALHKL